MADADNDPVLQIKLTSVRRYDEALAEAEARGYARGVEDAAAMVERGWPEYEAPPKHIRALLKPLKSKGEK